MKNQAGFSLIESLIVVSIITIMTSLAMHALPIARSNQQLIADTEQIRALLLDAKERAVNQVRPDACLNKIEKASKDRAVCSDVGIAFVGNQLIEFADVNQDNKYSNGDYKIVQYALTNAPGDNSFVFESVPPQVYLHTLGNSTPMGPSETIQIKLTGYGSLSRTLVIHSYGTMDIL